MQLSQATDKYLQYRSTAYASNTVTSDMNSLNKLKKHLGDVDLDSISTQTIDQFMNGPAFSNAAPATVNATLNNLKQFFKYCRTRNLMENTDPLLGQRMRKKQPTYALRIPMQEFPALLDAAANPRDRMLIACGLYLMLRSSEVVEIRIGDIDLSNQEIVVNIIKTKEIDTMPISPELDAELRTYLTWYTNNHGPLQQDWYLVPVFTHSDTFQKHVLQPDRKMTTTDTAIKKAVHALGYPTDRVGMHTMRRSAARAIFQEKTALGYDGALRAVSSWLHHSNQSTSEIYLGLDIDKSSRNAEAKAAALYPSLTGGNVIQMRSANGSHTHSAV